MSDKASKDPRFSQVYSDPRFKLPKKRDSKFDIDDRFTKDDLSLIKSTSKVDKYGRKITKKDDNTKHFDKYYKKKGEENEDDSESESESEVSSKDEGKVDDILARARGQVESSSDEESTDEEIEEEEEASFEGIEENEAPESEPTKRFAAVNLDWDNINSIDLFTTFSSFLPKDGSIKNVSIFKSEYGKQKLQEEDLHGPPKELFESAKNDLSSDDDSDEDEELDIQAAAKKLFKEDDGKADYNTKALRNYQLQRLRYFYAVIEFDSIKTSEIVYKLCDGTEFESTANVFDLRYIPDEMEFDSTDLKNSCKKVPNNYKPSEFTTDALRSSNIKLTWDETPNERIQMINKAFNQKDIDDMDFKAYLASDSEEGEMDEETKEKYKNLVGKKDNNKNIEVSEGLNGDDIDMEITFTPGLDENITDDKTEVGESSIDKLKNKEKERKKKRKERLKELKKESIEKKKNKRRETEGEEEELVIEEDGEGNIKEVKHFNMKEIEKLEKLKSKKKKSNKQKKKERELEEKIGDNEEITIEEGDDRFKEMLEGHEFLGGSKAVKNMRMKHKKRGREEEKGKLSDLVKKIKKSK